jgi:uncharacterized phage-associated protein
MVQSNFTPTKMQSLIVFVLSRLEYEVGSIELAKILYLIDVEKMMLVGNTITGDEYTRQKKGPLARSFQSSISQMNGFETDVKTIKNKGRSGIPKNSHSLGKRPRFNPDLDTIDIEVATRVLYKIKGLSPIQLERLAYSTEPMKKIIKKETESRRSLIGEILDFNSITLHPIVAKWRENMRQPEPPDKEFEAFLAQEAREIDQVVASLE